MRSIAATIMRMNEQRIAIIGDDKDDSDDEGDDWDDDDVTRTNALLRIDLI